MRPVTLKAFSTASDSLAETSSKLEKAERLGKFLKAIEDPEDLRRAVWFSAGRTFAATDERVTGASGAAVRAAVFEVTGVDPDHWRALSIQSGEAGEALGALWNETGGWAADPSPSPSPSPAQPLDAVAPDAGTREVTAADPSLPLAELSAAFDDLAIHGAAARKRSILVKLLRRLTSPRESVYLLKILFGDLRTGVQEGVIVDAIASAFAVAAKEVRAALLLEGDLGEVAVLAKENRLSDARFGLFRPVSFMLAAVVEDPAEAVKQIADRSFIAEDKLDGIRAQIHKEGRKIAIYTRTLDNVTESFPEVVDQIRLLHENTLLLDGEIVPWRENKALPFAHIQKRLGRKKVSADVLRENPVTFIAFDLLYAAGRNWMVEPLSARKACLAGISGLLTLPYRQLKTESEIASLFDAARENRNEGILLKDLASPYLPGRRGQVWYKLKTHLPTLDCVVTAAEHGHGKRRNHLSDYTFAVWSTAPQDRGELLNIGKAYSGVTDAEIEQLTKLFQEISVHFDGRVHQVQPKVVMEIAFDAIQKSDRHASGFALRFPRIKTIRWDKPVAEADTLEAARKIHDSPSNLNRVDEAPAPATATASQEPSLFDGL
jgi:DNA ligase 1